MEDDGSVAVCAFGMRCSEKYMQRYGDGDGCKDSKVYQPDRQMSDMISFDSGSVSDPIYEGATQQELYFIVSVNLLVVARLQIDDLLDTSEKIYKIQRPSQTVLPLGIWRWYYGLSRTETTANLQRLVFRSSFCKAEI